MNITLTIFLIFLGLELGSFANVCIYRWPRNQSILFPVRSQCPWCNHRIAWYDNIPVLSYFILRRKCRSCDSSISFRYPLTEIVVPILWLFFWIALIPLSSETEILRAIAVSILIFFLVIAFFVDLEWKIIPDQVSYSLIILGLIHSIAFSFLKESWFNMPIFQSLAGGIVGAGSLWFIHIIGRILFNREVMGWGDIKFLGGIGAFLGIHGVLMTLFLASVLGGLLAMIGLITGTLQRRQYIPFGPFLTLGGLAALWIQVKNITYFIPF